MKVLFYKQKSHQKYINQASGDKFLPTLCLQWFVWLIQCQYHHYLEKIIWIFFFFKHTYNIDANCILLFYWLLIILQWDHNSDL